MGYCSLCGRHHNVGFISTRFSGTDGVSLETAKWADVFDQVGFSCFYFAGKLDRPPARSLLVKEAHFQHPKIKEVFRKCFGTRVRERSVTQKIYELKRELKDRLYEFIEKFKIDLLVPENALTIPLNIPLGIAFTEVISETGLPTIAHHHDFSWERQHFMTNAAWEYLNMAFPPHLPVIEHVVINASADNQLSQRTGISATIIPNVMDFENPPPVVVNFKTRGLKGDNRAPTGDDYAADVRQALGVADDELLILQPTRVVKRKGIEHAIELVNRLGMKAKLIISHASGDEGFGNAFLEAVYFCRSIVVNTYSIYAMDIKPKGFEVIEIDGYVSDAAVSLAKKVLTEPRRRSRMVKRNYEIAQKYFSYSVLRKKLINLISDCTGCPLPFQTIVLRHS
jgi:glycosyltransferase involved in cell wall biosynthesis